MTQTTTISRERLAASIQPGDILLNLTSESIAVSAAAVAWNDSGASLTHGTAYPVGAGVSAAELVDLADASGRFVIVATDGGKAQSLSDQLQSAGASCVIQILEDAVGEADVFMDEEDSEAVAERLRQLGYI